MDIRSYERILESIPHAVYLLNQSGQLVYFNQNFREFFEEAFGKTLEPGDNLLEALPDSYRENWESILNEVWEKQVLSRQEYVAAGQLDRYYNVQLRVIDIPETGSCILTIFEETTYQRLSDQKHEAEELSLKESLLTRDTLLSIISHDLRAPIFQLNSLLFQLQQPPKSYNPERIQRYAKDLEERIFHLTNVLENLLRWSSSKRQRLEPAPGKFRLDEVIKETVGLLQPVASEKLVQIQTEVNQNPEMYSDRDMLAFIVRNLVSNAIKYSNENSEILVISECTSDHVILKVRDRGLGITQENIEAIFDPQNYFLKPGTSGERGTGLGLKLCQEFSEKLNGNLEIKSELNLGTEVILTLPISFK